MTGKKFILTEAGWRNNRQEAYFGYQIVTDERTFTIEEKIVFPWQVNICIETESLLRALHLALSTSYYKAFIPPIIEHPYQMTDVEATFWNTVYRHGLGEFLYKNKLNHNQLAKFSPQEGIVVSGEATSVWENSALLGIGGGKDSIVAGELMKEIELKTTGFVLATGEVLGQTQAVADTMGIELLAVKRTIDPQILDINLLEGSYNGHIPISLVFGLVGAILATSQQSRYVVVANEASASIPQTTWEGQNVNHQWSKSIEFERLFQNYLHAYVSSELQYFSAIRPLSSVAVAKIFSGYPQYFEVFTSDNSLFAVTKQERAHPRWSPTSSKSLSSFILLAPWLDDDNLEKTFGKNYLYDVELTPMLSALLGEDGQSVLDCVGTPDELKSSLAELIRQDRFTGSELVNYTVDKHLLRDVQDMSSHLQRHEHAIPNQVASTLLRIMESKI
jgi:UDP-N-acetyl-alpha-D-muramoyl-L-alanyl-L-glutamate epimerase